MRTTIASIIILGTAVAGVPALAGGIAPTVVEPAPVAPVMPAPMVTDWTGIYGGLSYSKTMGNVDYGAGKTDFKDGTAPGIFARLQLAERQPSSSAASWPMQAYRDLKVDGSAGDGVKDGFDLTGRLGYAAGRALLVPGKPRLFDRQITTTASTSYDFNGVSYGLGVDYLVTDNIFLGADYTRARPEFGQYGDVQASTFGHARRLQVLARRTRSLREARRARRASLHSDRKMTDQSTPVPADAMARLLAIMARLRDPASRLPLGHRAGFRLDRPLYDRGGA